MQVVIIMHYYQVVIIMHQALRHGKIHLFGGRIADPLVLENSRGICWIPPPVLGNHRVELTSVDGGIVLNPRRSKEMQLAPELIVGASQVFHGMWAE